jgi:hypothetical protein
MNGNAAKAGVVYFAVVFTTGFVLGPSAFFGYCRGWEREQPS